MQQSVESGKTWVSKEATPFIKSITFLGEKFIMELLVGMNCFS